MGKQSAEEKILEAARQEFLTKGFAATTMRGIADRAEINKGLLHYYFKTKEALIVKVFQETFAELFSRMHPLMNGQQDVFQMIESFVSVYSEFIYKHQELPSFIIEEFNRDPNNHIARMKKAGVQPPYGHMREALIRAKENGLVRPEIEVEDVMLNMISLVLYPLLAKPMIKYMHNFNEPEYKQLLEKRKKEIAGFIIRAIKT